MEQDPREAGRVAFERLSALIERILTENESWRQTLVIKEVVHV